MNRVKKYIMAKGYDVCEPDTGYRMYSKKHPIECGAVYAEGQHVDSEHVVQYEYVNVMGWEARIFLTNGTVKHINEDDAEWEQLKAGIKNDDIIFLDEWHQNMPRKTRPHSKSKFAIMYGGFFGWSVDMLDLSRDDVITRYRALRKAMPSLRLCVVDEAGNVLSKSRDAFDKYEYSKYKYDKDELAKEIVRVRNILKERSECNALCAN